MNDDKPAKSSGLKCNLPSAARRARKEAESRRQAKEAKDAAKRAKSAEIGGPEGPEPTRYGDWEKNGIASDFG